MDILALKLVIRDQTENIAFDSLALTITKADGTNFKTTSFSITDPLNPQVLTFGIMCNCFTFVECFGNANHVKVNINIFCMFLKVTKGFQRDTRAVSSSPLGEITLPASLTEKLSTEEQKMASRIQFTFFQKSTFFQVKQVDLKIKIASYFVFTFFIFCSYRIKGINKFLTATFWALVWLTFPSKTWRRMSSLLWEICSLWRCVLTFFTFCHCSLNPVWFLTFELLSHRGTLLLHVCFGTLK